MADQVERLVAAAGQLANAGRWDDAERAWLEVRKLEPRHPKALFSLGVHALQRGDVREAHALLTAARQESPRDLLVLMTLTAALRQRGDAEAEREAIEAALTIDPYFLPALLARSSWLERFGSADAAAAMFANALKVAPPREHWPEMLRTQLEHAREVVEARTAKYSAFLEAKLADARAAVPPTTAERWREAESILAGRSRPFNSECNQLHVPRLPAIPFFDRGHFPWIAALEAKTPVIRDELLQALRTERGKFHPYIAYRPGDPVNQWQELNHSDRWSTFDLWRAGSAVQENLDRCPETARALSAVEKVEIGGLCPNALFSALEAKTHIPPHNGETNARLVAHLPLIVPDRCRLRVGFEEREWKVGEVMVFDDTLEHEARNDSDELRVVLIFDVWNPLLEPAERRMVQAMAAAAREFRL
jgi:aspartyl/asparaginyl beta-hydroxylase (cupin superfamily)